MRTDRAGHDRRCRAKSPVHVVALDLQDDKLDIARACGADTGINVATHDAAAIVRGMTGGYGADVYLEATGHPAAVRQGLDMLRKLGTYVEYGVFGSDVTSTGASSATTRNSTSEAPTWARTAGPPRSPCSNPVHFPWNASAPTNSRSPN